MKYAVYKDRVKSARTKIATFSAISALLLGVALPALATKPALADSTNPAITNVDAYYTVGSGYTAISTDFTTENVTNATDVELRVNRDDSSTYSITAKQGVIDAINTTSPKTLTGPIVITGSRTSGSWNNQTGTWSGSALPVSVDVIITLANNTVLTASDSTISENLATQAQVLPSDTAAPEVSNVVLNGKSVNIARDHNCGPTDFNIVGGKIKLNATIIDNSSGVKNAKYKIRKVTAGGCTQTQVYQSGTVNMSNQGGNSWTTVAGTELNTAAVPEGAYTIQMTVTDNAGNTSTKYIDITVDNTAPAGQATYSGGSEVDGIQYVSSIDDLSFTETVTDNTGAVRATYLVQKLNPITNKFDGFCGNWNANSSGSHVLGGTTNETYTENNVKSCVADQSKWTDGTYKIFHAAYDAAGNEGKYNVDRHIFVIDSAAPSVTVTPGAGSLLRGTVTFTISVHDDKLNPATLGSIWSYLYNTGGTHKQKGAKVDLSTGTGTLTVDTTKLDDGNASLDIGRLFDAAGNASGSRDTYFRNYTIDNTAPTAPSITFPADNQHFAGTPILNDWTDSTDANGIDHYQIEYIYDDGHTFSGGPYRETPGNQSQRNHVPNIGEQGGVKVRVRAYDTAGNVSAWSNQVHYFYDATAPNVSISGYTAADNVITPSVTATDSNPSSTLTYTWVANDAASASNVTISDSSALEPDFTVLADGDYSFTLTVTDSAGNATTQVFSFTYTAPPVVTTFFTAAPGGNANANNTNANNPGAGNGNVNVGFTNVAAGAPGVPGNVLGAATNVPNTDDTGDTDGEVKGISTVKDDKNVKNSSQFLGLGFWWIPLIIAGIGILYWVVVRRSDSTDSSS